MATKKAEQSTQYAED